MLSSRLARLLRGILVLKMLFFASSAFAIYSDCTAPLPMAVNLPNVGVPVTLAVGQPIPGAAASFNVAITCTNTFAAGKRWVAVMWAGTATATPVPGLTNVYTTTGMGAGIGFRIRGADGSLIARTSSGIFDFGPATLTGTSVIGGAFELVKITASVDLGTFTISSYLTVSSTEYANAGNATKSGLNFSYTITSATVPACKVLGVDIVVPLQNVHVPELPAVGSTAYPTAFGIDLNCEGSANPQITLTDVANPSNQTTELTLAPGSTATGVAIQILSNGTLVHYSPAPYTYTNSNVATINTIGLGVMSGVTHIPFTARYIRVGPLTPGTVVGKATFTFTYQ
ncbi:fimbrial protein [Burkholderia sp. S171]|uniref:fimbrial protein n=1 Tax=Burkholderia sp. S171 TaxID=1641860 RepID=UPI00131B7BD5|nr:fimbrial protein [Burkholderia sp. S171]